MATRELFNECLHKLQAGDRQAIVFFYNNYYAYMVTIGKRFVSKMAAEDIASNIIIKLITHPQNYKDAGDPAKWLYTSVKNEALNYIRKENRLVYAGDNNAYFESANELCFTVDRQVLAKIELEQFFNGLDETDHEIAFYYFIFGYKNKEVAKLINMPEGTIKRRIHNIRKKFKEIKI